MIRGYGIAHVTLTVSNVTRTKKFYEDLFETSLEMDDENSFSLLKVGVSCWFAQWGKQYPNDRFDERRVGLDHVAFKLEALEELEKVVLQLEKLGVETAGLQRYDGKYP